MRQEDIDPYQPCPCGSGAKYKFCCREKEKWINQEDPNSTIQTVTRGSGESLVDMDYEDVRSVVFGSIEYARSFGFEPNVDWKDSQYILEPDRPFERRFEFGRNGEPLYIQGPDDNPIEIMNKLNAALNKSRKQGIFHRLFGKKSGNKFDDEWKTPKFIATIPLQASKGKSRQPSPPTGPICVYALR